MLESVSKENIVIIGVRSDAAPRTERRRQCLVVGVLPHDSSF